MRHACIRFHLDPDPPRLRGTMPRRPWRLERPDLRPRLHRHRIVMGRRSSTLRQCGHSGGNCRRPLPEDRCGKSHCGQGDPRQRHRQAVDSVHAVACHRLPKRVDLLHREHREHGGSKKGSPPTNGGRCGRFGISRICRSGHRSQLGLGRHQRNQRCGGYGTSDPEQPLDHFKRQDKAYGRSRQPRTQSWTDLHPPTPSPGLHGSHDRSPRDNRRDHPRSFLLSLSLEGT